MKNQEKYAHIKGWGIDADPENEPTYPMKKYTGDDHKRLHYKKASRQQSEVEVLMSIERPDMPAVYGTVSPPSGLSGVIRRMAFRHSESSLWHWLPLIIADRVNAVEGVIQDIGHGHFPNVFAERGWSATWKYARGTFWRKIAVKTIITSAIIFLIIRKIKS